MSTDSPEQGFPPRTASYEADPEQVGRVLLLYSGGLDTSVMLKWIQDRYGAEVVCLTVNLGQPGEDYEVIRAKALQLGALDCHVVDAREEFAREYLLPAIKANALYGDGYPLFTALGRPLIAKLAVERARTSGCDTIAHGCTGKGNDQVRIEATVATLAPGAAHDRAGALVADGPRGGDRLRARARHPRQGRDRDRALLDRRQPLGTLLGGPLDRGPRRTRPRTTSSSSSPAPRRRPTRPQIVEVEFERGVPVALDGERLEPVALIERAAEIAARHGVGIIDHIEDRIVGLKVRDIYEAPAAALLLTAHQELERLVCTIHQNQFKPQLDHQWAYLVYAGLWWEPLRTDLDAYMDGVNEQVTGTIGLKLYRGSVRVITRSSPNAVYDASLASFSRVRRPLLADGLARLHRAVLVAVAHGLAPAPRLLSRPRARMSRVAEASGRRHTLRAVNDRRGIFFIVTDARPTGGLPRSRPSERDLLAERRARRAAESGENASCAAPRPPRRPSKTLEGHVTSLQRRLEEAEQDGRRTSELAQRLENVESALAAIRESHRRMAGTVSELKGVAMRLRAAVEAEPLRESPSVRPRSEEMADALAAAVERLRARAQESAVSQPPNAARRGARSARPRTSTACR